MTWRPPRSPLTDTLFPYQTLCRFTLTVTECRFLETLAARPGIVRSRNQLMDAAYQDDVYIDDRTIDSHIKRLRRKFREVDPEFDAIATLYGAGYRFADES